MPRLFISYRRSDSQDVTGRLYDRLVDYYGSESVFRDVNSIPIATPFPELIQQSLDNTDLVLVVIGEGWLEAKNQDGSIRLHDTDDIVRLEIETALRLQVPIVPVLVSNAEVPNADALPESISSISKINGTKLRPDPDFDTDIIRLISDIDGLLGLSKPRRDLKSRVDELEWRRQLLELEQDWEHKAKLFRQYPRPNHTLLGRFLSGLVFGGGGVAVFVSGIVYSNWQYEMLVFFLAGGLLVTIAVTTHLIAQNANQEYRKTRVIFEEEQTSYLQRKRDLEQRLTKQ